MGRGMLWLWAAAVTVAGCTPDTGRSGDDDDARPADASAPDGEVPDGAVADARPTLDAEAAADAAPAPDAAPDMEPPPDRGLPPGARPRCPDVTVEAPPAALGLDPFYTRYADARGLPVVGGAGVPDDAFRVAVYVLENLLAERPCARVGMQAGRIRFGIMGPDDVTTDMPEYSDFYEAFPGTDWDNRGRGFGATIVRPLTTGAVENLLRNRADPWFGENIFLHEVAHSFFEFGVEELANPSRHRARLQNLYRAAMGAGLWAETYAATNANEYWAETVQSYFDTNLSSDPPNGIHNHVDTREELEEYDPEMAAFIAEIIGTRRWESDCDPDGAGPAWVPPPIEPADCALRFTAPPAVGCGDEGMLRSQNSDVASNLQVVNRTLKPVLLWWIDFEGQRQRLAEIGPRRLTTLQTFVTHGWVVTDVDGTCLDGFVAQPGETRFILE